MNGYIGLNLFVFVSGTFSDREGSVRLDSCSGESCGVCRLCLHPSKNVSPVLQAGNPQLIKLSLLLFAAPPSLPHRLHEGKKAFNHCMTHNDVGHAGAGAAFAGAQRPRCVQMTEGLFFYNQHYYVKLLGERTRSSSLLGSVIKTSTPCNESCLAGAVAVCCFGSKQSCCVSLGAALCSGLVCSSVTAPLYFMTNGGAPSGPMGS